MKYQAEVMCEVFQKATPHVYHPSAKTFNGEWRCCVCEAKSEYTDTLSDIAKVAEAQAILGAKRAVERWLDTGEWIDTHESQG